MIFSWLNNLKIRNKLMLLLTVPISVLLFFSLVGVIEKWHRFKDVQSTQEIIHISQALANIVCELENERNLSAAYFRAANTNTRQTLQDQWLKSNQAIKDLSFDSLQETRNAREEELVRDLEDLKQDFEDRLVHRKNIDLQEEQRQSFPYYTTVNTDALYLIERMGMAMEDAKLVKKGRAYSYLLWLQEYANLERDVFNSVLASGEINREELEQVQQYIAKQQTLLADLRQVTFSEVNHEQLSAALTEPGERRIEKMRQLVHIKLDKLDRLNSLQALIGFGGMIHHFKDYVLRGEKDYLTRFHAALFESGKLIYWYQSSPGLSIEERLALALVTAAFEEYRGAIITVEALHRQGLPVTEIDKSIIVDDTPVLAAFAYLRKSFGEIGASTWPESATERINLFKKISNEIGLSLKQLAEKETKKAQTALIGYISVTLTTVLIALILGLKMSNHLVSGIRLIIEVLRRVEETGDYSAYVEVRGKDEVAKMAESLNSLFLGRQAIENRLQLASRVFDNTIDGVLITDADEKIISVNRSVTRITGYSAAELIGQTPRILMSGRQDKQFYKNMWEAILTTGHWQGEIWNRKKNGEIYPEWQNISSVKDANGKLVNYISVFSDISAIKRSQEQMEHLAHHDPLTGLPNRLLFEKRLMRAIEREQRHHHSLALLFLDLDHFKNINDSLGHPVGDALLCGVSERMSTLIRKQDTIARLGGDEFAIILEGIEGVRSTVQVTQKIISALNHPFLLSSREVFTSTSIGISIYPEDGNTPDQLIKNADAAMYHAKNTGRNNYRFYNKKMTETAFERLEIETHLRRALRKKELVLHYQPQVSMKTGEIVGVEALVRWNNPDKGLILPRKFLPVAEETGLIQRIDAWVIHEACRQAQTWEKEGLRPVKIAVNLSGFTLEQGGFVHTIKSALQESGLSPRRLELEVTESTLIHHQERVAMALAELREEGVTLSIDDFGTGYSSLSYLRNLPLDKLKIDRIFVKDIGEDQHADAIIVAIIALGHALDLSIIAEGVETDQQAKVLLDLKCDIAQGTFYQGAIPEKALRNLLKK